MAADRIHAENHIADGAKTAWLVAQVHAMRTEHGCTFFRASFDPAFPDWLYLEGWKEEPEDQGPMPWEKPAPAHPTITIPPGIRWDDADAPVRNDCSVCGVAIAEEEVPLRIWNERGDSAVFCEKHGDALLSLVSFVA
jgi:hypothetical protein